MNTADGTRRVGVAYSGGLDSTALLHATVEAGSALDIDVVALHVHHGLNANADAWLEHCRNVCAQEAQHGRRLAFASMRVEGRPPAGESVEAWARRARYAALRAMALEHGIDLVLLAHHRRDQAETVLLQALRGAGVAGLAGMPRATERASITWARPWLHRPREAIEKYAREQGHRWIEDDSNGDRRFARNRLRLEVLPHLTRAFPAAEGSIADVAAWAREAHDALAELAAADLQPIEGLGGFDIATWSMLSSARRSNALRAWLKARAGRAAEATLVTRLMAELPAAKPARWSVPNGELRRYRGVLTWHPTTNIETGPAGGANADATASGERRVGALSLVRAGRYPLAGWGGCLVARRASSGGVAPELLQDLALVARSGSERFQAGPGRPIRMLKKQFQMAGVAGWDRGGPLVYCGSRLVFVPRLGIDARVLAPAGSPQFTLDWQDDAAVDARQAGATPVSPGRTDAPH